MCLPTMKNTDFLEDCKLNKVEDPNIVGFYFPIPVNPFRPEFIMKNGNSIPNEMIYSCCFDCAYETYFPPSEQEVELMIKDNDLGLENKQYYMARFPAEDLNSGVMITFVDPENFAKVFGEFSCFICDSCFGY